MRARTKQFLTLAVTLALLLTALLPATAQARMISGYTSKVDYDNTDPGRYQIEIDLVNQVITVYEQSGSIVLQGLCTTGNAENPTGAGTFKLGHLKERFGYFVAFGQYAQYWTQIVRGIYIHSIMYDSRDLTKLSRSAYNGLGKALSHGCVRVLPEHAKWIFYNCPPGTTCVVTRKKAKDSALVDCLKAEKLSFSSLYGITDGKVDPLILTAAVKTTDVPVRTGFSESRDKTVATLRYGDAVKLLQIGPDWCKVETAKGKLGYVKTAYLQFDPNGAQNRVTYMYYAKEDTALYQTASVKATKLEAIPKDAAISVIGTRDRYWYTAIVNGQFGYVRSRYTRVSEQASYEKLPELPGTVREDGSTVTAQAYIKNGIIANLRNGPGTGYDVIGELHGGVAVTVIAASGRWYKIDANGLQGYVSAICLQF